MRNPLRLNEVHLGNVKDLLKRIPDKSVDCVVTSPPYWGLRDYGTSTWVGGTITGCDHSRATDVENDATSSTTQKGSTAGQVEAHKSKNTYRGRCEKCGAIQIDEQIGHEKTPEAYVEVMIIKQLAGSLPVIVIPMHWTNDR